MSKLEFDTYCKNYIGGKLCKRVNMHVPKSWCTVVCKGNWDKRTINVANDVTVKTKQMKKKPKEKFIKWKTNLNIGGMAANFGRAMIRFTKDGFKKVDERVFVERQICCSTCGDNKRCPYCRCVLKLKALLNSEKGCPNPETYPNLQEYPPRDFWQVCSEKTSAIITSRNEPIDNLNKTISSLFDNATGELEVIVVLDGGKWNIADSSLDKRAEYIINKKPQGRRISSNKAAKQATGKYLFHIDAHCTMSKGWDTKMKCSCDDSIVFSVIQSMDENWNMKNRYYTFCRLDVNLESKWWGKYKPLQECEVVEKAMSFTGCGWMISKEYYWRLSGFDEQLGEYGYTGTEWSLKTWMNDGELLLRTDVLCGHIFATNKDDRHYKTTLLTIGEVKNIMYQKYGEKIRTLVDKFLPLPEWEDEDSLITIVKCTDNHAPKKILKYCESELSKCAANSQIITVAKAKKKPRGSLTMYEQLLEGLSSTEAEFVFIAEHDVLYHPSHFEFVPKSSDVFYYDTNRWRMDKEGFFQFGTYALSMLVGNRELLIKNIKTRIDYINNGWKLRYYELGISDPITNGESVETYQSKEASVDIRHGMNFTDGQKGEHTAEVKYWGNYKDIWLKLGEEIKEKENGCEILG